MGGYCELIAKLCCTDSIREYERWRWEYSLDRVKLPNVEMEKDREEGRVERLK